MDDSRSVYEQTTTVLCPKPERHREDDQIVEIFLHAYRQGQFSEAPEWLPQDRKNVEVIASNQEGTTSIAIEHTRIFAFEDHKYREVIFHPFASSLEAQSDVLPSDKCYELTFPTNLLDGLNAYERQNYQDEVKRWIAMTLPSLIVSHRAYKLPCPPPKGRTEELVVAVAVWEWQPKMKRFIVNAFIPSDPDRLVAVVRKALFDKVPKLAKAEGLEKILLIEMPMISDSQSTTIEMICRLGSEVPDFPAVDQVVIANSFSFSQTGAIFFYVWSIAANAWTDYLKAVIDPTMPS